MKKLPPLDFNYIKTGESILTEIRRHFSSADIKKGSKADKYYVCCWLHNEDSPSMCINNDTNSYHCFGCGKSGGRLDIRIHFMGLNPGSGVDVVKAAQALLADMSPSGKNKKPDTEEFEKLKTSKSSFQNVKKRYYRAQPEYIQRSHERLVRSNGELKEYATRRGWLIPENNYPIGMGYSFGPSANEFVLEFPKIIQTLQTAIAFGLEKEWVKWNGKYAVDLKKRLSPRAEQLWWKAINEGQVSGHIRKPPRWTGVPEYHDWIPWEFDQRNSETADVLCVTEGPGDGLRFVNELIRNGMEYNFHVTGIDCSGSIKSQNFVRVLKENKTVNFFDNYKEIWFFYDGDTAGDEAIIAARELLAELKPMGLVKFVKPPKLTEEVTDLCDYFDNEGCVADLLDHIDKTDNIKFN